MDDCTRTDDTATAAEMRELFDEGDEDGLVELVDAFRTHSGEWRRDGEVWRWWQHNDVED